jgi:hypothetical protein
MGNESDNYRNVNDNSNGKEKKDCYDKADNCN